MSEQEIRRILVTGATGGIGQAICMALAEDARSRGLTLKIAALATRQGPALDELTQALAHMGAQARGFAAELTDSANCREVASQVTAWAGGLDVLVSNAGQSRPGLLADLDVDEWDRCFALNVRATWLLAQSAHAALGASRGNIVAVASMSGLQPHPGYGAYSPAKAALAMLCRQLAQEWGGSGIRVNAVCPGMIRTPLTEAVYQVDDLKSRREALVPLARIGQVEDIAQAVVFLAGPGASYITGANLLVDGGVSDQMLSLIPGRPDKVAPLGI